MATIEYITIKCHDETGYWAHTIRNVESVEDKSTVETDRFGDTHTYRVDLTIRGHDATYEEHDPCYGPNFKESCGDSIELLDSVSRLDDGEGPYQWMIRPTRGIPICGGRHGPGTDLERFRQALLRVLMA